MEASMLILGYKRLIRSIVVLILGLSLIFYGIIGITVEQFSQEMSDEEIIQRAKDLGMIEIKEKFKKNK